MEGRYPYTQPGLDDMTLYDTAPILAAWTSGDTAALSDRDRVILEKCRAVIDQVITADMSDYEKEAAIYCWVTTHGVYDYDHYDPQAELDPDSYNPYGLLTNGKGVCLAFATTFQLFLDLLEVECITVVGASYRSSEDHAWNMVRLDGQWYCVDPTWDLNSWDESMGTYLDYVRDDCTYFNVTSQYMAETDHQWDYTAVPEAEG
jgi:transglutaminase/protease-like cytokinesis protein 3